MKFLKNFVIFLKKIVFRFKVVLQVEMEFWSTVKIVVDEGN